MEIDVETRESRREFYNSDSWRKLRLDALYRDHHECVWCRGKGRVTRTNLEVDHIKELEYYPEHALDLDNLRTLCKECHNKRHNRFQFRKSSKMENKNFRTDEWWGEIC
nr:MAG TPA: HNH endonuclease [Caudoviricetes sp.]